MLWKELNEYKQKLQETDSFLRERELETKSNLESQITRLKAELENKSS